MKTIISDIDIAQNASFSKALELKQDNGLPFDLTNYTGKAQLRTEPISTTTLADFQVTFGNRSKGEVTISLPGSITSTLSFPFAAYDFFIKNTITNDIFLIIRGKATLIKAVTKNV